MVIPLSDCNIEEQRTIVRFLWVEAGKHKKIHHRVLAQYGTHSMNQQKVYGWVERFEAGRTSVTDVSRSGRSITIAHE